MLWIKWVEHLPLLLGPFGYSLASHPSSTMKGFLGICLLLALISPVTPLTCYVCNGSPEECEEDNVEKVCGPDEDSCSSIIANVKLFGGDTIHVVKGCSKADLCVAGIASGAANAENSITYNIECCQTDNCNVGIPSLDYHEKNIPNGLTCPGCFDIGEDCSDIDRVSCMGDEDQCFNITATGRLASDSDSVDDEDGDDEDSEASLTFLGCGSIDFCDLKKEVIQTFLGTLEIQDSHVNCYLAKKEGDIEPIIPPVS